jgi:SAM-dependent methyltransferase
MVGDRNVEARARLSLGTSDEAIYRTVARALQGRHPGDGTLIDVGCGHGRLWKHLHQHFRQYVGVDVVRYDGFPAEGEFCQLDLDRGRAPLPDGAGEVAAAVETIEHLENPRAFVRELTRLVKPGGWVVVTTPNQLSLLSKLTLLLKNQFNAFQAGDYPAHLTALLEIDLRRMVAECGLTAAGVDYSRRGRMPGLARHFPTFLSRWCPRTFSDNVLIVAQKPAGSPARLAGATV